MALMPTNLVLRVISGRSYFSLLLDPRSFAYRRGEIGGTVHSRSYGRSMAGQPSASHNSTVIVISVAVSGTQCMFCATTQAKLYAQTFYILIGKNIGSQCTI